MKIIQKPTAYSFAGNIADIIVSSDVDVDVDFVLLLNGVEQLRESYTPDADNKVVIRLREIAEQLTPHALLDKGSIDICRYSYTIGHLPVEVFNCIGGGHGASSDTATFIRSNWLTWQPQSCTTEFNTPQRLCYATTAECTVKVKAYFADNSKIEKIHSTLIANKLYTIDATFGTISSLFDAQPVAFDIWVAGEDFTSFTQRYYIVRSAINSDVFMWHGSLGGVETAIFTGDRIEQNDIDSSSALIYDESFEYSVKATKSYTKYTGYIGNNNTRLWVLDFFTSISKYRIDDVGARRKIIVSKPKLEHTRGEIAGYEFIFADSKQSKYINLARLAVPENLSIADPGGEVFFLAPRLNQFQRAEFEVGDILIPVQYAAGDKWLAMTIADILANAGGGDNKVDSISSAVPIKVIRNGNSYTILHLKPPREEDATNYNQYGNIDDTGHVVNDYHPHGGRNNVDFTAKLGIFDTVKVLSELITPVLVKNEVQISRNESWFTDGGVVDKVTGGGTTDGGGSDGGGVGVRVKTAGGGDASAIWRIGGRQLRVALTAGQRAVTFKELPSFRVGDLLKAITEDTGEGSTVGFRTAHYRVDRLTSGGVILKMLNSIEPCQDMVLARVGSDIDTARQSSVYVDALSGYLRVLDGMSSFEIAARNVTVQLGNLTNLSALGVSGNFPAAGLYAPGLVINSKQVDGLGTSLSLINGKIEGIAKSVETVDDRVTSAESKITQTAQEITSKVSKDDVVSTINQSAEAIKIAARLIELTGDVTIVDAFIDKLVVNHLRSKNGEIDIKNDGTARIGDFNVDGSGTATIKDGDEIVSTFSRGKINTLEGLLTGNDVGSVSVDSFSASNGVEQISESLFITGGISLLYPNTDITITGMTVSCLATAYTSLGGSGASSAAQLFLVDDSGHSYNVANLMAFATNGHADDVKAINFVARMPYAGTYRLRLDYSLYANGSGATSSVSVSAGGTIVKNFVKAKNESQLGRGLAVVFDGNNYLYYGNRTENSSSKELIYKGALDIPGVLAKARITSTGYISRKWGKNISSVQNITGQPYNKRVMISPIAGEYSAICTPYGGGSMPVIYNETSDYIDLYATGGFNIMLIGNN